MIFLTNDKVTIPTRVHLDNLRVTMCPTASRHKILSVDDLYLVFTVNFIDFDLAGADSVTGMEF